jgi:HD-like signal output (HDOD) protein
LQLPVIEAPVAEPSASSSATAPPSARDASDADAAGLLREEIAWRLELLREGLTPMVRTSDSPALLDSLSSETEPLLRQPPDAARRALTMTRETNTNVIDLVLLIERDPGLAQGLLQQANSSYYSAGAGSRCTSLAEAVARVGMRGVENVMLAAMVGGMLCRPGGAYSAMVEQVWSHMVRTAPIARRLASGFDVDPEQAYALGLLHDAGKLVLFDRIAELRSRWRREVAVPHEFMVRTLKVLHESVGGLAVLDWGLGADAARAVATHHRVMPSGSEDALSAVIYVAERADLAALRGETIALDDWWAEARLPGSPEHARFVFDTVDEEAA